MKKLITFFALSGLLFKGFAVPIPPDEGMWLLMFIGKYNYEDMKKLGLKLTAEQLYSVNNSSIKDAVVGLGVTGYGVQYFMCTGEVVSDQGLILTNHHCGFDAIQSQSTDEHNYLEDGFWAKNKTEELPIKDMTMSFLIRMDDVTGEVLKDVTDNMADSTREKTIAAAIAEIERTATEKGKYQTVVKSMFENNEFYLFVYETYKDIRLVGAPPSSIGKFGGDTDNWMWPRHTGDFSMFRIYTAPDGSPAKYSDKNIPLVPKHYLPISLKGVHKDDFSMIFGFPGETQRFMTSHGVELALNQSNPLTVKIRDKKLSIMKAYMDADEHIKLQYASKYAQSSNGWKMFKGQNKGLVRWNVVEERKDMEAAFLTWAKADATRLAKYGNCLNDIEVAYKQLEKYNKSFTYIYEAGLQGPDFILFSYNALPLYNTLMEQASKPKAERAKYDGAIKNAVSMFETKIADFFKDFDIRVDKDQFVALMEMYYNDIPADQHPWVFKKVKGKQFKGDFKKWGDYVYENSIFMNEAKLRAFLKNPTLDVLKKDPGFEITRSMIEQYFTESENKSAAEEKIKQGSRLYVNGLMQMNTGKKFYPDANFTMRMTYGTIQDYYPVDAVHYDYRTSLEGVIEKEDSTVAEFVVEKKLKDLYARKDFGQYGENGVLYTCFLSNNDITGGNSGSPVINGNGELIGIAFDGNWESLSGDIAFEPDVQRTISVDIRYVLFVIDKFAGATNLIDEMKIMK